MQILFFFTVSSYQQSESLSDIDKSSQSQNPARNQNPSCVPAVLRQYHFEMQNTLKEVPCTWFCRKLSSSDHLLSARYSTYTSNSSVSCTHVGFLNTCCSLHSLPSDFKYLLSLQFPHLSFCHTTSIFYYLQRPSSKFLVVYCQIICS